MTRYVSIWLVVLVLFGSFDQVAAETSVTQRDMAGTTLIGEFKDHSCSDESKRTVDGEIRPECRDTDSLMAVPNPEKTAAESSDESASSGTSSVLNSASVSLVSLIVAGVGALVGIFASSNSSDDSSSANSDVTGSRQRKDVSQY